LFIDILSSRISITTSAYVSFSKSYYRSLNYERGQGAASYSSIEPS
jgi:hypothetical protein